MLRHRSLALMKTLSARVLLLAILVAFSSCGPGSWVSIPLRDEFPIKSALFYTLENNRKDGSAGVEWTHVLRLTDDDRGCAAVDAKSSKRFDVSVVRFGADDARELAQGDVIDITETATAAGAHPWDFTSATASMGVVDAECRPDPSYELRDRSAFLGTMWVTELHRAPRTGSLKGRVRVGQGSTVLFEAAFTATDCGTFPRTAYPQCH